MRSIITKAQRHARNTAARARVSRTARRVVDERLTYLSLGKLRQLESALKRIEPVPGGLIECGVALGGSAVLLARYADENGRTFDGYDVFGMIPPPGEHDPPEVHERYQTIASGRSDGIRGDTYYGYRKDLYEHVQRTLARYGAPVGDRVRLHRGLFEETLHPEAPVALAHVDCDWYEPVKLCFERIVPKLSPGAVLVIDDYHDYGGAARATDELLDRHDDLQIVADDGNVLVMKTTDAP